MADLWQVVDSATEELGFELIDLERTPGGITRVYIDVRHTPDSNQDRLITIEDCELVSKQLVHLLPVEGFDFQRLEVSSPGMDRPLTKPEHYARFSGAQVKLRLRMPLEGRKNFEGVLRVGAQGELSLEYEGKGGEMLQLDFQIDDIDKARLVPEYKF